MVLLSPGAGVGAVTEVHAVNDAAPVNVGELSTPPGCANRAHVSILARRARHRAPRRRRHLDGQQDWRHFPGRARARLQEVEAAILAGRSRAVAGHALAEAASSDGLRDRVAGRRHGSGCHEVDSSAEADRGRGAGVPGRGGLRVCTQVQTSDSPRKCRSGSNGESRRTFLEQCAWRDVIMRLVGLVIHN